MTRKEFSALTKIGESTINFYETNPNANITYGCLNKIAVGLNKIGVFVSVDAFLETRSFAPYFTHDFFSRFLAYRKSKVQIPITTLPQEQLMQHELSNFLMHHPNAIGITVNDDDMLPFFGRGDLVGGILIDRQNSMALVNKLYLFTFVHTGLTPICGILRQIDEEDSYIIGSTNLELMDPQKIILGKEIEKIAEIIWIRRRAFGE